MTLERLKAAAEEIFKLDGVCSVTVGRLSEDPGSFYYCYPKNPGQPKPLFDHACQELQGAAIKMLDNNDLELMIVVIDDHRILVARWRELACAVMTKTGSEVNKSIRRKIRRVGQKYDRRDPDNTRLGKALGELERSNPEVAKAADNYDRMVDKVLDR